MTQKDTYDILYDKNIKNLKSRVQDKKVRGFKCLGGVCIHEKVERTDRGKVFTTMFYQAMELDE